MNIGRIVISKAGRDKGIWFVVVGNQNGWIYIANGNQRKLEKPKKKNQKHLVKTNKSLEIGKITNKILNKVILELKSKE